MGIKSISRGSMKTALIVINLALSLVSVLGVLSTFEILGNENNIDLDFENFEITVNETNSNINFRMVFNNTGFYDFDQANFTIGLELQNKTSNSTFLILNHTIPTIKLPSDTKKEINMSAGPEFFNITGLNADLGGYWGPFPNDRLAILAYLAGNYTFRICLYLEALYSLDLVRFQIFFKYTITEAMLGF